MAIVEDVERLVEPFLKEAGIELVQVQYQREQQGWMLRFFLDKENGITLSDCSEWTNRIDQILEENNIFDHPYVLEVSSPGLNRPLRKPEDFKRFVGLEAVVKLHTPLQSGQRNFHGKILSFENTMLDLLDRTSGVVQLSYASIASAKLDQ